MPATSFVAAKVYDWTLPPARVPAKSRCRPKRKPKPKKKRKAKKPARLSVQVRSVLIDRLEAALSDGRIELCAEDMPCESLDFTLAELAFLLGRVLFPEEYRDPAEGRAKPPPTKSAPASAERIAEYAWRVAQRRAIHVAGDAVAHGASGPGLKIEQRKNGSGVKVVGWADEE